MDDLANLGGALRCVRPLLSRGVLLLGRVGTLTSRPRGLHIGLRGRRGPVANGALSGGCRRFVVVRGILIGLSGSLGVHVSVVSLDGVIVLIILIHSSVDTNIGGG